MEGGEPVELAARHARQPVEEDHHARQLVLGEPRPQPVDHLALGERRAGAAHDRGGHLLAQRRMRQREGGGFRDVRMLGQKQVDLGRRDLLAAAVDDVLKPAGEEEEAVGVEIALVAGAQPVAAEEVAARGLVLVAGHDVGPADQHLAAARRGQLVAEDVGDAHGGAERPADRARPALRRIERRAGDQPGRLGHAEHRHDADAERGLQVAMQARRQRLRDGADEAQPAGQQAGPVGMAREDVAQHGRHRLEPGRPERRDAVEEGVGRDGAGEGDRAARIERREQQVDQRADMEHRHHGEPDVVRPEPERAGDVPRRGDEVAHAERHPLRRAGRAGGMQHQRDAVGVVGTGGGARGTCFVDDQVEGAGGRIRPRHQPDHRQAGAAGSLGRDRVGVAEDQQMGCRRLLQDAGGFLRGIGGVDGHDRCDARDRQDGDRRLGRVGQDRRHTRAGAHAGAGERGRRLVDDAEKLREGAVGPPMRTQRHAPGIAAGMVAQRRQQVGAVSSGAIRARVR
ncbi:MAG: hypothetical protein BGN94_17355 [Rhizobiales bacterium 68-8]|nr:MAG: hypothetical protein BGN94_17355 [Rhizobiales bacterium 68-8]